MDAQTRHNDQSAKQVREQFVAQICTFLSDHSSMPELIMALSSAGLRLRHFEKMHNDMVRTNLAEAAMFNDDTICDINGALDILYGRQNNGG